MLPLQGGDGKASVIKIRIHSPTPRSMVVGGVEWRGEGDGAQLYDSFELQPGLKFVMDL
jgi:hypothetical protein